MLLRATDVFDLFVEPFIHSGFRPSNRPYSYYYRSIFSLHNETLSVWIHLLGSIILIAQIVQHVCQLKENSNSIVFCIYIIYNCIGACAMLLCSAQAHLLHSRTVADHVRSFYLDYFGMNFYGFTSGVVLHKFSHRGSQSMADNNINEMKYYFILGFLSLYSLSIACFCKTFYRRPYPFSHKILQCSGVVFVYLYQIWPILNKRLFDFHFYQNENLTQSEENALFWHLMQILLFILSGLIFVARIPERFRPGLFDFFGQSHHGFHLTIFLVSYSQANAVFEDILSLSSNSIENNVISDIFYTLIVLFLQIITVSLWYRISRPRIEQRYNIKYKD